MKKEHQYNNTEKKLNYIKKYLLNHNKTANL